MLDISAHARQARSEFWYKKFELNWSFIEKYSVKKDQMEKVRGCYNKELLSAIYKLQMTACSYDSIREGEQCCVCLLLENKNSVTQNTVIFKLRIQFQNERIPSLSGLD